MENWLCVQKAFRSQSLNNKGRIAPCHPTAGTTRLSIVWDKHATSFLIVKALDSAVWPNVAVKSSPNVSKSCPPKSRRNSFYQKVIFQNRPKVTKYLGYFCKKIWYRVVQKISQIWSHWSGSRASQRRKWNMPPRATATARNRSGLRKISVSGLRDYF